MEPEDRPATRAELIAARNQMTRWAATMDQALSVSAAQLEQARTAFQNYHVHLLGVLENAIKQAKE